MKIKYIHYFKVNPNNRNEIGIPYKEIDINLDLHGIPNRMAIYGTESAFTLSEEQERFVKQKLQLVCPQFDWKLTQELLGDKFNPEANRILGDIVAIHPITKELICIDVKVCAFNAKNNYMTGTIKYSSLTGFANNKNHYYLSITKDGSDFIMIPAIDIYNIYLNKKCLISVEEENNKLNYKIDDNKYLTTIKPKFSCSSDYIPSFVFYPRYKK